MSRILTYLELDGRTWTVGNAYFNFRRGRLTATFSYDRDYLAARGAYAIDPELRLSSGSWALPHGLPGAFSDAAPDRWGRNLIAKRLRAQAGIDGRAAPTLDDRDYLLGVSDETRQGALRFKTDIDGDFQHPAPDVPKLIALPTLLHAANAVAGDEPDNMEAVKTLLDAGTGSLGGARPKASVRDGDRLLILHRCSQHRRPPPESRVSAARRRLAAGARLRHQPQPGPRGAARHQHRGATGPADEVQALLTYSDSFGLTGDQARAVLGEVADAAGNWEHVARRNRIAEAEITRFDSTLKHTVDACRPGRRS